MNERDREALAQIKQEMAWNKLWQADDARPLPGSMRDLVQQVLTLMDSEGIHTLQLSVDGLVVCGWTKK